MALDCNTLSQLSYELDNKLRGGRIDKVYQMSKTQILVTVRSLGDNYRLYISCDAQKGRVCLTQQKFQNPDVPPVFCMLLRKHLCGGKINSIYSVANERIVKIEVENSNELFEVTKRTLIVEIMGKHSNIILTDEDNRIADCVSHVDFTMSEKRHVLPGLYYVDPPIDENKFDPNVLSSSEILEKLNNSDSVSQGLMDNFIGMSPILTREIQFLCNDDKINGSVILKNILKQSYEHKVKPVVLTDKSTNEPKELYFFDIVQYDDYYNKKYFDSVNECVDYFYSKKENKAKENEKKQFLKSAIHKNVTRISKKLDIHLKNIKKAQTKDKYRVYAELITANLYKLTQNAKEVILENYYDEYKPLCVPMDETMSPARNAKKYFEKYNKEKNMEKISTQMVSELNLELSYLNEISDMIDICDDDKSLNETKEELIAGEYLKDTDNKKKSKKLVAKAKPLEFTSTSGIPILCGRNNRQNEELTLKIAFKSDLWLHIRNAAGSHTVIRNQGETIDDKTLEEAAIIAAYYSKKMKDTKVDVDYTQVKYVKKLAGGKTGMVTYENFKSITVSPNLSVVEMLKNK